MADSKISQLDPKTILDDTDMFLIEEVSGSSKRVSKVNLPSGDSGDMTKAVYDPTGVEGDAFNMDNMIDGDSKVALTKSAQQISGTKRFLNRPKLSSYSAPTADEEFVPKRYFDENKDREVLSFGVSDTFTIDNATQLWLMNSKAHYYNGKTYLVYVDFDDNSRKITCYNHTTDTWVEPQTISNTGMAGSNTTDENRAHAAPTVALDSDGYIHVAYTDYKNNNLYYRRSENTEDISSWNTEQTLETSETSASYPTLIRFTDNNFTLFYRGSDGSGNTAIKKVVTTDGGSNWGSPETILTTSVGSERIYYLVERDPNDIVHMAWHFYDGTDNKDLHYMKSSNANGSSSSWTLADGTSVTTSIDADNTTTRIFDSSSWDTCYLAGLAYGDAKEPMIIVGLTDSTNTNTNKIEFFRESSGSWSNSTVLADNGVITTFTNQDVLDAAILWDNVNEEVRVAFVISVSSQWEIQEYYSSDYSTWLKKRDITSGSSEPNVTPLYPQNTQDLDDVALIWFSDGVGGDYGNGKDISYTGEDTSWSATKIGGLGSDVADYDPVVIVSDSEPSTMPDGSTIPENSVLILTS